MEKETSIETTAVKLGEEFARGFCNYIGKIFIMLCILMVIWGYVKPIDDCDIDRFNRCGVKVITDNKTSKQYLLSPQGGIIERINNN